VDSSERTLTVGKKQLREFENILGGLDGGVSQYRKGIDEYFVPHGFDIARDKLAAAQCDLEKLGLYEQCRDALLRAEELVKRGPEHDHEAEMLILNANRALMAASGTYEAMSKILRDKPNATIDDFKPDPDGWAMEDEQEREQKPR
jgi:hypothetical protein